MTQRIPRRLQSAGSRPYLPAVSLGCPGVSRRKARLRHARTSAMPVDSRMVVEPSGGTTLRRSPPHGVLSRTTGDGSSQADHTCTGLYQDIAAAAKSEYAQDVSLIFASAANRKADVLGISVGPGHAVYRKAREATWSTYALLSRALVRRTQSRKAGRFDQS
jgi:hypothetical protein